MWRHIVQHQEGGGEHNKIHQNFQKDQVVSVKMMITWR